MFQKLNDYSIFFYRISVAFYRRCMLNSLINKDSVPVFDAVTFSKTYQNSISTTPSPNVNCLMICESRYRRTNRAVIDGTSLF